MADDNLHIETDKLFQAAFAGWEAQPAPDVWDKVEARLDGRKRRPLLWWWLFGAIFLTTGTSLTLWFLKPSENIPREYFRAGVLTKPGLDIMTDSVTCINYIADSTGYNPQQWLDSIKKEVSSSGSTKAITSQKQNEESHTVANSSSASPLNNTKNSAAISQPIKNNTIGKGKFISVSNNDSNASSVKTTSLKPSKYSPVKTIKKDNTLMRNQTTNVVAANSDSKNKPVKENSTISKGNSLTTEVNNVNATAIKSNTDTLAFPKTNTDIKKTDTIKISNNTSVIADLKPTNDSVKKDSTKLATKKDSVKKDSVKKLATHTDSIQKLLTPTLFSVSIYYSPEIARNDVTTNNMLFNIKNATPVTKYSLGFKFNLSFGRFELNAGIAYSKFSQNFALDTTSFSRYLNQPFIINTSLGDLSVPSAALLAGYSGGPTTTRYHIHYTYSETVNYINVPINARLNLSSARLKPYVTAGINLQYAVSENAILNVIKDKNADLQYSYTNLDINKLNVALSAGFGLEYNLVKKLSIYIEPNVRLNTLSLSADAKSHNYFMGCQGGLRLGL